MGRIFNIAGPCISRDHYMLPALERLPDVRRLIDDKAYFVVREAKIRPERETLGSASPFNVITEAMTLRVFTQAEVAELYRQHTDETGQDFEPGVAERAFEYSGGQPYLVNELSDDLSYVLDLGLLVTDNGSLRPANPMYGEIIGRYLSWGTQQNVTTTEMIWYNMRKPLLNKEGQIK